MGLYLCVFADDRTDEELDGVEVGSYDDFHRLRAVVAELLEGGAWGTRFPVLMEHPDSDGAWSPEEAAALAGELDAVRHELAAYPAVPVEPGSWQAELLRSLGVRPQTMRDCFIDVDGEPLLDRMAALATLAHQARRPITFQ